MPEVVQHNLDRLQQDFAFSHSLKILLHVFALKALPTAYVEEEKHQTANNNKYSVFQLSNKIKLLKGVHYREYLSVYLTYSI